MIAPLDRLALLMLGELRLASKLHAFCRGKEGTGKGVFLHTLRDIFGCHGVYETRIEAITGKFNSQLQDALYLFADEISWRARADRDALKSLVTDAVIQIEHKGLNRFPVENRIKIAMGSNSDFVVPAGPNARRFAVFDVSNRYAFNGDLPEAERKAYFEGLGLYLPGPRKPRRARPRVRLPQG